MSETDIIEDAPEQEPASIAGIVNRASDRIEYVLPCAHTHRGKTYQKGDTLMLRADAMFKRLKASRLDNSTEAEMRRLTQIRLLIIDDFALQPMDATATADFYELVVARHQRASTVLTSNRSPDEWPAVMTDPLLAQSAVDRLTSTAHELVIEGQSYRRRQKPSVDTRTTTTDHPQ